MLTRPPSVELLKRLACPRDQLPLTRSDAELVCAGGHRYPIIDGIPVLLLDEAARIPEAIPRSGELLRRTNESEPLEGEDIDPFVQRAVMATCGILYKPLIGRLQRYPIPDIRLPPGEGRSMLDIGCNWGRWCVSAARRGYVPIGIDYNFDAVRAARRVAHQLGVGADFVVGDVRYLPFRRGAFDVCFSYSVLQHLSKEDARRTLGEVGRVLRGGGISLIQMANALGLRSIQHQLKRGFRPPREMEVRYWTPGELLSIFTKLIGSSELTVDGFFGLGVQTSDVDLLRKRHRAIVRASEFMRSVAGVLTPLSRFADSVYIRSIREESDDLARSR